LHAQEEGLDMHPQIYKKVHHVLALLHVDVQVDSRLEELSRGKMKCVARGV
jgi:hypothetical protein